MFAMKLVFPCTNATEKDAAFENIVRAGGQIQNHRINFAKREIIISVLVEPDTDRSFRKFIDGLPTPATITTGTRGGRGETR